MTTGTDLVGSTLRHYRVLDRLGQGGMGEVYLAEDLRLGRQVALKFLTAPDRTDPDARARLLREAQAAALLRSPHIAVTYELGEHDHTVFIAMELVEGELLSTRLRSGPLPVDEALDIAGQVADALDEAHAHGIVHRDIKSANLMVTPRRLVKVLDFGLAKFLPSAAAFNNGTLAGVTLPGAVLGTVSYMSPEQVRGGGVDHRADLFSLGVVLYEMLAGQLPFQGESLTDIADRILHREPDAVARFNYSVPAEVEHIIRKALEKRPDDRYQSARELFVDLSNAARRLQSSTGGFDGFSRWRSVTGSLSQSSTSNVLAGAAGSAAQGARSAAVLSFVNITGVASDDWIGQGIAETLTADLKHVSGVTVIPREQIFDQLRSQAALGRGLDERQAIDVGRRLGAWWVLTGGYQHLGSRIRITAYVIEVLTGRLSSTVKVDGAMDQLFDLQDEVVRQVARSLDLPLASGEGTLETTETSSLEAYEAFARGMLNLRLAGRESLDRAIALFERALEHDPGYAEAALGLGTALQLKGSFLSLPMLNARALELLQRALRLKPGLVDAQVRLGMGLLGSGRAAEATALLESAVRNQPDNAMAHAMLGRAYCLGEARIDDGLRELEEAVAIYPEAGYAQLQLAFIYALAGRLGEAERAARSAIVLQDQSMSGAQGLLIVGGHSRLGYVLYRQGRYDEAIAAYRRELEFLGASDHALRERSSIELWQKLYAACARKGGDGDARDYRDRALDAFTSRLAGGADDPFTRYYIATLFAIEGDSRAVDEHLELPLRELPAFTRWRLARDPDFAHHRPADSHTAH